MQPELLLLALAPVGILLAYVWLRDKYEKEPWRMLFTALLLGAFSVLPVIVLESLLMEIGLLFSDMFGVFWHAFVVAAFSEESFKLLFLLLLVWKSPEFNEKFDGIVYAVFVSLGFAAVENVLYVFDYGVEVGFSRAVTAVPGHFLFGVTMGFYVGLAKFYPEKKKQYLRSALFYPLAMHGVYDFILMANHPWVLLIFVPFVIFMWRYGLKKMNQLSNVSIFHTNFKIEEELLKKNSE